MLSPQSSRMIYATTLLFSLAAADISHEHFHSHQRRAQYVGTASGCYSTPPGGLTSQGSYPYQSSAHCGNTCAALSMPVMALSNGNECACGDLLPAASSKVDDSSCSVPCTGYPGDSCGSNSGDYTVWLTGVDNSVGAVSGSSEMDENSQSSAVVALPSAALPSAVAVTSEIPQPSTTIVPVAVTTQEQTSVHTKAVTAQPTTIVQGQQTIVKTIAPAVHTVQAAVVTNAADEPATTQKSGSGSGSTIGIAVGAVAGVILLAAIIVFMIFYQRRRRRLKNAENGHARADSLNAFVAQGGTLPGVPLANDTRLDPRIMTEKRQSTGSVFADNEDYSRRILKVANPSDD